MPRGKTGHPKTQKLELPTLNCIEIFPCRHELVKGFKEIKSDMYYFCE